MAAADNRLSMGHSMTIKRVQTVIKQPLVLGQRVANPEARQEKRKKRKKKGAQQFEDHVEDKILISGESRQSTSSDGREDPAPKQARPGARRESSAKTVTPKSKSAKLKRLDIMV